MPIIPRLSWSLCASVSELSQFFFFYTNADEAIAGPKNVCLAELTGVKESSNGANLR